MVLARVEIAAVDIEVNSDFLQIGGRIVFTPQDALELRDFIDEHLEVAPRFK